MDSGERAVTESTLRRADRTLTILEQKVAAVILNILKANVNTCLPQL